MGTEQFKIRARIVAVDDTRAGMSSISRGMDQLEGKAQATGLSISRFLGGAFALLGGGAVLGAAARGVVGLQTEIQNAEGALATLFIALEGLDEAEAIALAKQQIDELSRAAASGVGGLQDYTSAFQMLFAPTRAAGATFEQIQSFTAQSLTAAAAMNKELGQAPLDIVQALQMGINDRMTPIAKSALEAFNKLEGVTTLTAEQFNKLTTSAKMDVLAQGFGAFAKGAALMGQQWDAQIETLFDGVKRILRTVTAPIFERWSESLRTVNLWLEKNEGAIEKIARDAGVQLLDFFDEAIDKARTLAAITAGILIAEQAKSSLGGGAALSQIAPLIPGAGPVRGVRGGFAKTSGFTSPMVAIGNLLGVIARLAGPAALLALAFVAVDGAMSEFPSFFKDLASEAAFAMESAILLAKSLGSLGSEGSALNLIGLALILPLRGLGTVLGVMARVVGIAVEGINLLLLALGDLARFAFFIAGDLLAIATGGDREGNFAATMERMNAASISRGESVDRINRLLGRGRKAEEKEEAEGALDKRLDKGAEGKGDVNINVANMTINAKTELNEDPTRVVKVFGEVVEDLSRFRRQPRGVPGVSF